MKTLIASDDSDPYERYRNEYRSVMQRVRTVFESARRLR